MRNGLPRSCVILLQCNPDARGRPATDLRLCVRGGTAQLHTTRAHRNMPLEAVQSLVDLGLSLLETFDPAPVMAVGVMSRASPA